MTETSPSGVLADVDHGPAPKLLSIPPDVTFGAHFCGVLDSRKGTMSVQPWDLSSYLKEVIVLLNEKI